MPSKFTYTLTEVLHESAGTIVYRGHRNEDRKPVAIKRLKSERPTPAEARRLKYE